MDDSAQFIVDQLADVNSDNVNQQYNGQSLLHLCFTDVARFQIQIETILDLGIDVNLLNEVGETALMTCPYPGKIFPLFLDCILEKTDINIVNASGWTLMHYACKFGNKNLITKILTTFGEDILHRKAKDGTSPVGLVSRVDILETILDCVKNFQFTFDDNGKSELRRFLELSRYDIAEVLLRKPVNPPSDMTEVIDIIIANENEKLFKILTQFYSTSVTYDNVRKAVQNGRVAFLRRLTEGENSSFISCESYEIFYDAVKSSSNSMEMFEFLQANISNSISWHEKKTSAKGENIAHFCCSYNKPKILDIVLLADPDVIIKPDNDGVYPLSCFITYNRPLFIQSSVQLSSAFCKLNEKSDLFPDLCKANSKCDLLSFCVAKHTESIEALKSLVEAAFPIFEDTIGRNIFHLIALHHKKCEALSLLLDSAEYKVHMLTSIN